MDGFIVRGRASREDGFKSLSSCLEYVIIGPLPLRQTDLGIAKKGNGVGTTSNEPLLLLRFHLNFRCVIGLELQAMGFITHWRAGTELRPLCARTGQALGCQDLLPRQ